MTSRMQKLAAVLVACSICAGAGASATARATTPFDGEFGGLIGLNRADADMAGPNGQPNISPLLGVRWASRISTPVNWFLDGVYAEHETSVPQQNSKMLEMRTGLERLFPIGDKGLNWYLAGAVGIANIDYPSGLSSVERPLFSAGIGLARDYSSGILRGELRAEQLVGEDGLNGAAITNAQLFIGWSFGLRSHKEEKPRKALFGEGKKTLILEGVNFVFDKADLTPESFEILDGVAASLKDWPEVRVEIGGHTDFFGDDAYNQGLSERRAETVRNYLITKGIASSRLSARGYGETEPIAENDTPAGQAKNRRVELKKAD